MLITHTLPLLTSQQHLNDRKTVVSRYVTTCLLRLLAKRHYAHTSVRQRNNTLRGHLTPSAHYRLMYSRTTTPLPMHALQAHVLTHYNSTALTAARYLPRITWLMYSHTTTPLPPHALQAHVLSHYNSAPAVGARDRGNDGPASSSALNTDFPPLASCRHVTPLGQSQHAPKPYSPSITSRRMRITTARGRHLVFQSRDGKRTPYF
jgi:hypothetical protein